jgi:type III pantothenate kinase
MKLDLNKAVFADFGNSRAKFLLPDGSIAILDYINDFLISLNHLLRHNTSLIYSSVNEATTAFINAIESSINTINASDYIKKQTLLDISAISGMGDDRVLGLLGAMSYRRPPIITIDCGTATTINVLHKSNKVLGGMIMPGFFLQEKALKEFTSGLKSWQLNTSPELIGKTTDSAISSGILNGTAHAISGTINQMVQELFSGEGLSIFLTGGSLSLILPLLELPFEPIVKENLVLEGIKYLMEKADD